MPDKLQDPRNPTLVDVAVGRNVRVRRMARGLSQTDLANRVGVTFQQVQKYEAGSNRISMGRLKKIAKVLRVHVTTLFEGSDEAEKNPALLDASALIHNKVAFRLAQSFAMIPESERKLRSSLVVMVEHIAAAQRIGRPAKRKKSSPG
ncbi:MAG TPA: helix-turn-helix transcriptional regulator [Steroidobacteraceae bacterium]|jgi:transcriptional regulator with XRE-family HTH domain|nr:helix-turn-helix transcriptional regulator [Steroidobacteraceae bacterium]